MRLRNLLGRIVHSLCFLTDKVSSIRYSILIATLVGMDIAEAVCTTPPCVSRLFDDKSDSVEDAQNRETAQRIARG